MENSFSTEILKKSKFKIYIYMNNVYVHRKKNHLNKAIVSYLRFQKKMLFLSNFFFFFYSFSGAIYLFHRPMVTKPISVTRSNGRLGRCTKSWCAKNEQNITWIPKTRTKNAVRFALFSVKTYFYQTYTNDLHV